MNAYHEKYVMGYIFLMSSCTCANELFTVKAAHSEDSLKILPNFNIKDSEGQTVLGLALWSGLHNEADRLLGAGANINEKNSEGMTLLHQAIEKQDTNSALFLIEHQADLTIK